MNPKLKLYDQVAVAQDKAVRAAENLQQDDDLADELASLSVEEYAARRGWEIVSNPNGSERKTTMAATSKATQNLAKRVEELEAENEQLIDDNQYLTEQLDEIRSIATSSLDEDDDDDESDDDDFDDEE